jgi:glutamine transport system permease protein
MERSILYFGLDFALILKYKDLLIEGFLNTILLTLVGVGFGLIIGLILGLGKISHNPILKVPSVIYVEVFRGTPFFVQLLFIHFGLIPVIWEALQMEIPGPLFSGFVALSLNSSAYIAEIFRAGIQSIDRGQMEAARSLGMTHGQSMSSVILPQAFKRMLPPLGNESIALLKDSAMVAIIAAHDLGYWGFSIAKNTFDRITPYVTIAVLYLILTLLLSRLVNYLERRYKTE